MSRFLRLAPSGSLAYFAALGSLLLAVFTLGCAQLPTASPDDVMTSYRAERTRSPVVFVHGVTGGGWDWRDFAGRFEQLGHPVYRVTLSGLGEKQHLSRFDISLDMHIADVSNLIRFEELEKVILIGHSYGGMVLSGVMHEMPERLQQVIFLDAIVPRDGQSVEDAVGRGFRKYKMKDNLVYYPWLDSGAPAPKDVPQPLGTLTQPVQFNNPKAMQIPASYIAYTGPLNAGTYENFAKSREVVKERGWRYLELESDHNAHRSRPEALFAILEDELLEQEE